MTEHPPCWPYVELKAETKTLYKLIDEREKQAAIHLRNYEREVETEKEQLKTTREQMEHRLAGMNEFQKRMDKLEGTFATKTELTNAADTAKKGLDNISRLVYIGFGILLAVQFLSKYFFQR